SSLEPGNAPQRRQIGRELEVAVAAFPRGELVTRYGIHLHVEGEQIVAPLRPVSVLDLLEEEVAMEALAEQAPLHIRERHDHGVDRLIAAQLVERQHIALLRGGSRRAPTPSDPVSGTILRLRRR